MDGYSFKDFSFREEAYDGDLTAEEERFIYLYNASRNDQGRVSFNADEDDLNAVIDAIDNNNTYVVCDDYDEIVGVVAVDPSANRLWLEGVAVDPEYRSNGIGAFILKNLVKIAIDNDCDKISGYSQPNSRTVSFYEQNGGYFDDEINIPNNRYVPMSLDVSRGQL